MASAIGLIRVMSQKEVVDEQRKADSQSMDGEDAQFPADLSGLAGYIRKCWDEAHQHKQKDLQRFIEARYARQGIYTPAKLREIMTTGGSTEYARIVANKARILEAWLKDIFLNQEERPWTIEATPQPDLPADKISEVRKEVSAQVAAMVVAGKNLSDVDVLGLLNDRIDMERSKLKDIAESRAQRMADLIADQLAEGGFPDAFSEFISHFVTYPGAILKGPIFRKRETMTWSVVDGTYVPEIKSDIVMEFEAVDPFNIYPAPGAATPQEGYIIEHLTLTANDLYNLIDVDGYDEAAIRVILARMQTRGSYRWIDPWNMANGQEANDPTVMATSEYSNFVDVLEFHGPVSGALLREWGVKGIDGDEQRFYEATVWLIDDQVIKAVLNDDPMGRRPYYKACYEPIPGYFWGYSMYDTLSDIQGVCNAAIRSLVNNMAIASGPQVVVNVDRLPAGEDITSLHPWKIWQVNDSQFGNNSLRPVDFFQPTTNVQDLLTVLDRFYALADDFSLIPRYMAGSDKVSGPARTASGLSMLLDAANKGIKSVVQTIDSHIMTPLLQQLFTHNMIYSDDENIKGDSKVVARGVASLMQLETLRMRRNEFLQITANPIDSQIVGVEGRAAILREIAKTLGMDVNKIVPPNKVAGLQTEPQQNLMQAPSPSNEALPNAPGTPTMDVASPSAISSVGV